MLQGLCWEDTEWEDYMPSRLLVSLWIKKQRTHTEEGRTTGAGCLGSACAVKLPNTHPPCSALDMRQLPASSQEAGLYLQPAGVAAEAVCQALCTVCI